MVLSRFTRVVLILALLCGSVRAQPSTTPKTSQEFAQVANALYASGDFEGAISNYQRAYELQQHPTLLFNAAQAHRKALHWHEALALYERFLREAQGSSLAPEAEAHSSAIRAKLSAELAQSERAAAERLAQQQAEKAEALARAHEAERQKAELELQKLLAQRDAEERARKELPTYKKGWFKAVMAVTVIAAIGGIATGIALGITQRPPDPPMGELGTRVIQF